MATAPAMPEDELLAAAAKAEGEQSGMEDTELAALLQAHEAASVGYYTSEIAAEQAKAIDYYYGRMDDLPALDGCSSVVDHTVAVMVDNGLASILKPFVSADEVVTFTPRGPEDGAIAEQATEYVNYVIQCDNPGFQILHDWFKDALLTKLGVVKVWWEDQSRNEVKQVPADVAGLLEARQAEGYLSEQEAGPGLFLVSMQETIPDGRVKIENVPPEEFLVSPLARSVETAPYLAHRPNNFTRSDLIEMGVDQATVDSLPGAGVTTNEDPRQQSRYQDESWGAEGGAQTTSGMEDKSRDIIAVVDEYVRVDFDGDGISELRRVVRVDDVILLNEPIAEAPFALLCPVPMPHKIYGRSLADLALEGQKVSTAVLRQTLDNLYKTNNPRPEVPDTAVNENTWDDLADSAPGAAIRTRLPGQMQFFSVPFTAGHSFQMLETIAQQTEERTGIQRKGNGLNPETLKKNSPDTATQASIDENSRNERAEMIARIFAETGVKRLFKLILGLLQEFQPQARVIRLRNQWVPMDPRGWPEMDVAINVGLGVGNKGEQIGQANTVLTAMAEMKQTEFGYLITPQHAHKAFKRLLTATGIKDADQFIADPATVQAPPPAPDPETAKIQAEAALKQIQEQGRQAEAASKAELERQKAAAADELERMKAAAKANLDREQAEFQAGLAREKSEFEAWLARQKLDFEQDMARRKQESAEAANLPDNRAGGDLSK